MNPALRLMALLAPAWHPRKLFATADMGTIQTPSNWSALYQESSGMTAGAIESPVGLLLDERYSLATGANLDPQGTTGTFPGAGTAVDHGDGTYTASNNGLIRRRVPLDSLVQGGSYLVRIDVSAISGTAIADWCDEADSASFSAPGTVQFVGVRSSYDETYRFVDVMSPGDGGSIDFSFATIAHLPGNHAIQVAADNRPTLKAGGKIDYDGVNDQLVTTWGSALGSSCTVGRSVPQGEATILTGQTIATTYTDNTDHCGLVIINRDLSATETNQLRRWLNRKAG